MRVKYQSGTYPRALSDYATTYVHPPQEMELCRARLACYEAWRPEIIRLGLPIQILKRVSWAMWPLSALYDAPDAGWLGLWLVGKGTLRAIRRVIPAPGSPPR